MSKHWEMGLVGLCLFGIGFLGCLILPIALESASERGYVARYSTTAGARYTTTRSKYRGSGYSQPSVGVDSRVQAAIMNCDGIIARVDAKGNVEKLLDKRAIDETGAH